MATRDHLDQISGHHQPPPALIGGRYRPHQSIGESRVAITYRARDVLLSRTVALKLLRPEYADQPSLTRFMKEVTAAATIDHPSVVPISDYGVHEGRRYVVMEYVHGRTLRQIIDEQGPLAPAATIEIVRQLLHGLSAIHAAGIVHRNLTPQNVLVGDDGRVRVTDFGICPGQSGDESIGYGIDAATAAYLAPEQIRGDAVSPSTDLYAVGVVLFELLTWRLPFELNNPEEVLRAHLDQPPPAASQFAGGIPPALDAAILRALAKDPADRYTSTADMARALDAATSPQQHTNICRTNRALTLIGWSRSSSWPSHSRCSEARLQPLLGVDPRYSPKTERALPATKRAPARSSHCSPRRPRQHRHRA